MDGSVSVPRRLPSDMGKQFAGLVERNIKRIEVG